MLDISLRAKTTPPSPLRSLAPLAAQAEARGITVHKLNIGQPDLQPPKEFLDGLTLFPHSTVAYESSQGNLKLIQSWVDWLNNKYSAGLTNKNMIITSGSSEALTFVFSVCCDVGDEILVFDPTYANYTGFASLAGVTLTSMLCEFTQNFQPPNILTILNNISHKTKAILLCNPNNPTGTTLNPVQLQELLKMCEVLNIFLIVDEVYREFVYDQRTPHSILQHCNHSQNVIVIDSVSKRYSLCGARIGCVVSYNSQVLQSILNLASTRVAAPTIEQYATAHMLQHIKDEYLVQARNEYNLRRTVLVASLMQIPGVKVSIPDGGFYVLAELPVQDSTHFAKYLLESFNCNNETLFLAPAEGFYTASRGGQNCVRIAFVHTATTLQRAALILEKALEQYHVDGNP